MVSWYHGWFSASARAVDGAEYGVCAAMLGDKQTLQQNPVVPPTLLSAPSPHGTPPAKGPEKSHQVLPPL